MNGSVYAGYYGYGVYKSDDSGKSWALISGSPTRPRHMTEHCGKLYVTCYVDIDNGYNCGIYAYDPNTNQWIADAPIAETDFGGITKTISSGKSVLICTGRYVSYYKEDNGEWTAILDGVNRRKYDISENMSWATANSEVSGDKGIIGGYAGALAANPLCRDGKVELWLGDGWTIWCNSDVLNSDSKFYAECKHLEETVVNAILAPPSGDTVLLTGIYDYTGFRHKDLSDEALFPYIIYRNDAHTSTYWGVSLTSFDYCAEDPNFMAYYTDTYKNGNTSGNHGSYGVPALSYDNGETWYDYSWEIDEDFYSGNVAVGAKKQENGYPIVIAIPKSSGAAGAKAAIAKRTNDFGKTWTDVSGLPENLLMGSSQKQRNIIAADRVNGSKFYVYDHNKGEFYYSEDKGISFNKAENFVLTQPDNLESYGEYARCNDIEANPNTEGDVIFCSYMHGLFRTTDGGKSIYRVDGLENVECAAFGANVSEADIASIFVIASIDGKRGLYRSDDNCNSWIFLNIDGNKLGNLPRCIEGDKREFGRVYVGTTGRGVMYFDSCGEEFVDDIKNRICTVTDVERIYAEKTTTINGNVTYNGEDKADFVVIIASYDSSSYSLRDIKFKNFTNVKNGESERFTFDINAISSDTVKIFVFNSFEKLTPLLATPVKK